MDYIGTLVIAFVVCTGGGTIRNPLLGRFPIFWLTTPAYVVTVLVVSVLGQLIESGSQKGQELADPIAHPVERLGA